MAGWVTDSKALQILWYLVQAAMASNAHQPRSSECASSATKWNATSKGHQNALAPQDEKHPSTQLQYPMPCRSSSTCASRYSIECSSSEAVREPIQPPSGQQAAKSIRMPLRCRTKSMTHIFGRMLCRSSHLVHAIMRSRMFCSIIANVHAPLSLQTHREPPGGVQPRCS